MAWKCEDLTVVLPPNGALGLFLFQAQVGGEDAQTTV